MLELSSFQLMTMNQSPHIAVVTNLAPNHLDVHKSYGRSISAAKENIFPHQQPGDIAIFNAGQRHHPAAVPCAPRAGAAGFQPAGRGGERRISAG